jgi:hypothetical protein
MPVVRFLATRDGETAFSLSPVDVASEQTSLQGLREAFFERTGVRAFVLHDGGLDLSLNRASYTLRMEEAVPGTSRSEYPPLERAGAWQQPGWFRETLAWLERTLGETVLKVEQVNSYDLACTLRVETGRRAVYLKASETGLEATLSAHLAARYPKLTPEVIAWDERRHLLVTQDCGTRLSDSAEPNVWSAAVKTLAHFQRTADPQVFESQGCPIHAFRNLAERAATFLADTDVLRSWGLNEAHFTALADWVPHIGRAHERVLALDLPLLPAHGDAHPMNVLTGCKVVWFDWSEGNLAHPLLDISWFLAWLSHPARDALPLRQAHPDAATELWRSYLQELNVPEAAELLHDVTLLALIHRILVYHERFHSWQGTVPGWRPEYVPYYLRVLLKLPL